ncbi:MAG: amidohydrolase family protein [Pseudoxanthomonas sp.]
MKYVDSHQHYWKLARGDYGWLTPEHATLYRDFVPGDLLPELMENSIAATVLVQAAPTEEETRYLLGLAQDHASIAGVVGWVDFEAQDAARRIGGLVSHGNGMLKGLRPMTQDIGDADWLSGSGLDSAFDALVEHGLTFDALVRTEHLHALRARMQRNPGLKVVIDHGAKPPIASGETGEWLSEIQRTAAETSAYCKLSGLLTEAAVGAADSGLQPYVDHLIAAFGAHRVMWGSDWPVLCDRSSYSAWLATAVRMLARNSPEDRQGIFGENAVRFYSLDIK